MPLSDVTIPTDTIQIVESVGEDRFLDGDTISVSDNVSVEAIATLSIDDARPLTERKVRIDFSAPTVINDALTDPASYTFEGVTPGAVEVIPLSVDLPQGQANPRFVEVNLTEHTNDKTYQVTISDQILGQNGEVGGGASDTYVGIGISPLVTLVQATSPTEAVVIFDEDILDNADARDPSNFTWAGGLSTVSVKDVSGNTITLETTEQTPNTIYTLTVGGGISPNAVTVDGAVVTVDGAVVELTP